MSGNRINCAIPSFINGVSQQPPTVRLATQAEALENGLPTVSDGLRKRPFAKHMRKVWDGDADNAFTHLIDRDKHERYMAVVCGGRLKVLDLLNGGVEVTVSFPDGTSYLQSGDPRRDFHMITVADTSFITNKTKTAAMTGETTPAQRHQALAYVKHGYTSTSYTVTVNGASYTHSTPDSTEQVKTTEIAGQLAQKLRVGGVEVDQNGSVLLIQMPYNANFSFSVTDSWGEQALIGVKDTVALFTDLPAKAFDGFKVRVTGESKGRDDDYYVEYNSAGNTRNGTWDEVRGWGLPYNIDPATMPHMLQRQSDGTFVFRRIEWEPAKVGDDDSCPPPSFLGSRLAGTAFHQNRLGIIADENIILSRDGDFFNFWPKTATTVVATDPIDYAISDGDVSSIRHTLPFADALMLFSDKKQFQLTNGGSATFSPDTVRIDLATSYDYSPSCQPVIAGQNIYFAVESTTNTAIMEYFVTVDTVTLDAVDVTAHAPRYLPKGVFKMCASTNDSYLICLSSDAPNRLWLYKYFWIGEDKVQSAWSVWEFAAGDRILSMGNTGPDIYMLVQRRDGCYLEHINMQSVEADPGMTVQVHLDRKIDVMGVYDAAVDETVWTLPYDVEGNADFSIVLGGGFAGKAGKELKPSVEGLAARVPGRYDGAFCHAGLQYRKRLRLSRQYVRESRETAAPTIASGRLQLLNFILIHRDSGYFRTEVHAKGRGASVAEHLGTIGDSRFTIGSPVVDSQPHKFFILAPSDQVEIDVVNDKHYPSSWLSGEWTGLFTLDARRM